MLALQASFIYVNDLFYTSNMYIKVRVIADAKREEFTKKTADNFKISVREKAERNMANRRVIELMAKHFKIQPAKIRIVSGHHSPSKILSIDISG